MRDEAKLQLVILLLFSLGIALGCTIGYSWPRKAVRPPVVNVHIIGTPDYTAVDSRDTNNIIFYVNTNCVSQ